MDVNVYKHMINVKFGTEVTGGRGSEMRKGSLVFVVFYFFTGWRMVTHGCSLYHSPYSSVCLKFTTTQRVPSLNYFKALSGSESGIRTGRAEDWTNRWKVKLWEPMGFLPHSYKSSTKNHSENCSKISCRRLRTYPKFLATISEQKHSKKLLMPGLTVDTEFICLKKVFAPSFWGGFFS